MKFSCKNASSLSSNGGTSSLHDIESERRGGEGGAEERELQMIPTEDNHKDTASFPATIAVKVCGDV